MKKKILKIFLFVILILVLLLIVHTIRNFVILKELQNKSQAYSEVTNFSVASVETRNDNEKFIINYYQKDDKFVRKMERIIDSNSVLVSEYYDNKTLTTFIDTKESKIFRTSEHNNLIPKQQFIAFETENAYQTLVMCLSAKIKSDKYNGKDCYVISEFNNPMVLTNTAESGLYFEKDTGLNVKIVTNDSVVEREFQFNNVDDSIFVKPDISQYTPEELLLEENN